MSETYHVIEVRPPVVVRGDEYVGCWIVGTNELETWWRRGTKVLVEALTTDATNRMDATHYRITGQPWTGTAAVFAIYAVSEMPELTCTWRRQ